jgi:hypothetical protein
MTFPCNYITCFDHIHPLRIQFLKAVYADHYLSDSQFIPEENDYKHQQMTSLEICLPHGTQVSESVS